jgi:hypothetical protein
MYKFVILALICLFSHSAYADETFKTTQFRDYVISRISLVNGDKISITKKNNTVFEINNATQPSSIKTPELIVNISKNNGIVIIKNYSGGARCCYDTIVFNLGDTFSEIARFNGHVEFKNLDRRVDLEAIVSEEYSDWTPFSHTMYSKAVLRYQNGSYVLAFDLMKRKFNKAKIKSIISRIRTNYHDFIYVDNFSKSVGLKRFSNQNLRASSKYFIRLLPPVLDLIYSGNYPQALIVIDKTWPGVESDKNRFVQDLISVIKSKKYGRQILNHSF